VLHQVLPADADLLTEGATAGVGSSNQAGVMLFVMWKQEGGKEKKTHMK